MRDEPATDEGARRAGRNLPLAIATGLGLAAMIFGTLFTSRPAWFLVVLGAVLLSQWELYNVLERRGMQPAVGLGLGAGGVVLIGAYAGGVAAVSFGISMTVLASLLWFVFEHDRARVADRLGCTLLGVAYLPVLASHVVMMRDLPRGVAITIGYLGLVAFYDIGAYAAGTLLGRHRIAPAISPGKTWEGVAGGTLTTFVLALLVGPMIEPFDAGSAAVLALAASVLAPFGDLVESMLKRDLGVKDMGTLLPGHGGMLDRIDALLVVAPAAYWITRWMVA